MSNNNVPNSAYVPIPTIEIALVKYTREEWEKAGGIKGWEDRYLTANGWGNSNSPSIRKSLLRSLYNPTSKIHHPEFQFGDTITVVEWSKL